MTEKVELMITGNSVGNIRVSPLDKWVGVQGWCWERGGSWCGWPAVQSISYKVTDSGIMKYYRALPGNKRVSHCS